MEKRSHRRIRDLDILAAFQGLVANEIGCARISMMAREQNTPFNRPNTDARDQLSPDRHIQLAPHGRSSAARLAAIPAGESPANRGVQSLL